jgi:hypothetical protein
LSTDNIVFKGILAKRQEFDLNCFKLFYIPQHT